MCIKSRSFISNIVSIAVIMTALVAAARVSAATVTNANDFVTTLQSTVAANHEVLFTTPSDISEGSNVSFTFDSSFNTSSLTEDDVDVADNGVELTTANDCSGSEKASIAIAGHTVTIAICAGNGGAIASGHAVRVRIGTNATNSGTGTHQIINPSSAAGLHYIAIAGSFGNSGTILLPIRSGADAVNVTATVGSGSGGGGGGGGGCTSNCTSDTTPPVISNIVVSGISASAASISWTTDEAASSKILYGTTSDVTDGSLIESALATSHVLTINGLSNGVTYYFEVKSSDAAGNEATSTVATFSTLDTVAPIISAIVVDSITKSAVRVSWITNENSTSVVEYGFTSSYGSNRSDAAFVTSHTFTLSGLTSGTEYHFHVKSQDASTNLVTSSDQTFTTLVDLPPANVSGLSATPTSHNISLSWTNPTDEDFAGVNILRCTGTFPSGPTDSSCTNVAENLTATFLVQTGLTNNVTYYYGVFAKDLVGQFASGALVSGKPSASELDVCGDRICGSTETALTCPLDCAVPPVDVCGDRICGSTETNLSCPADCAVTPADVCGDRICGRTETAASCPADCTVTPPPVGDVCGNGMCESTESTFTCPADCHVVIPPPTDPLIPGGSVTGQTFQFSDVAFFVASGAIQLPQTNGNIEVLPRTGISVKVPASVLGNGVKQVTLAIGASTYLMRPMTTLSFGSGTTTHVVAASSGAAVLSYQADILAPSTPSLNPVTVFVDYTDGKLINVSSFLRVIAPGYTHEIIDGEETSIGGVNVTLYKVNGSSSVVWDGSPYTQPNPTTSASDGTIAWYVPNGTYKVHAELATVKPLDTSVFSVSNSIANPRLVLLPVPKPLPLPQTPAAVIATTQEAAKQIVKNVQIFIASPAVQNVAKSYTAVTQSPIAQTAAQVSLPTLAVSAGASVVFLSTAFDFLPFVQYLFTAPLLLLWRKKRKGFGVVYNAVSKQAIGLAVVRLYSVQNETEKPGKLIKSRVTDTGGRFFFLVQPGLYRLAVTKIGFQFPTTFLRDKKEDVQYLDLYHGELVTVKENDAVLTPNIPLDPSQKDQYHEPAQIRIRARLQFVQHFVALFGTFASIGFLVIRPTVLAAAMVIVQLAIYLAVQRIAKPRKPKSWGIVYDEKTGRPVANVVARVFEPKYNKLLETQVTDNQGRYSFLLGPSEYFAVFEKDGYRSTRVGPIDYSHVDGAKDFSVDVKLEEKL